MPRMPRMNSLAGVKPQRAPKMAMTPKTPRVSMRPPPMTSRTPPLPQAAVRPEIRAMQSPIIAVARPAMVQPTSQGVMVTPTPHPSRNLGKFLHPAKKPF